MKATELMIGDWVYVSKNFTQKYHKIRALSNDKGAVLRGIYVNEYGVECNSIFSPNDTEPIPFTPEILEKNGFIKQNFDGWEYIHPNDSTFSYIDYRILWRTDYDNHLFIKKYKGSNIFATLQISRINYVHQLQQALRLCGIEKEIELWKQTKHQRRFISQDL